MLPERTDNDVAADVTTGVGASSDSASAESEAAETKSTADASSGTPDAASDSSSETEDQKVAAVVEKKDEPTAAVTSSDDPHAYDGPSIPFVPHHLLMEGIMALAFLTFGLIFIALFPVPLEPRANPFLSPEVIMPEWYLLAPFELLHLVAPLVGQLAIGVAVGILLFWPFIDRRPRRISRRPFVLILSFLILGSIIALTVMALLHVE